MYPQTPASYVPFHQKRIDLSRNLITLEFVVVMIYTALHFILDLQDSIFIYLGFILIILIQMGFYRLKFYSAMIIFSIVSFNLVIYLLAASENLSTGVQLHFISAGAASLSLYGYQDWRKGISFTGVSLCLFLVLHITGFSILPTRVYAPSEESLFFWINVSTMTVASIACILLILKMNFDSERSLLLHQALMETKNEELKKTNAELDRFVYSASHDLRAPLSSIAGLVQIMKKVDPATKEYTGMIQNRVEAMDKFIGEIIDYSRNARVEVEAVPIRLKSMADEVWDTLNYFEGSDKVKLIMDFDQGMTLESDPYRLKVILNNLMTNAIKYADHRRDSFVKLSAQRRNDHVEIQLEDNGIGIHPQHQGKVFDMFYRATEASKGSGLGLYIVQETINKMTGSISLTSQLGKGTCITFSLPDSHTHDPLAS